MTRTLQPLGWVLVAVGVLCIMSLGYCAYDGNRDRMAAERLASGHADTFEVTVAARDDLNTQVASDTQSNTNLERDLVNAVSPLWMLALLIAGSLCSVSACARPERMSPVFPTARWKALVFLIPCS